MTDITELAQRLKLEVNRAVSNFNPQMNIKTRDLKELVEALEKAQQRNGELDTYSKTAIEFREAARDENRHLKLELEIAEKRIAELESRAVTVKQGEVLVTVSGFTGSGKSAIAGEIEIAMKAIGVPFTWDNGDSEKRMTGADWLTAIEMYKPTVRIVEENIPRAAGFKVEAE